MTDYEICHKPNKGITAAELHRRHHARPGLIRSMIGGLVVVLVLVAFLMATP